MSARIVGHFGIAWTVRATHGRGECPLSARLRIPAGEAPVSGAGRQAPIAGRVCGRWNLRGADRPMAATRPPNFNARSAMDSGRSPQPPKSAQLF